MGARAGRDRHQRPCAAGALMLKPDSIREALTAALPDYARDPDRLAIFAEKGRIATRPTAPGARLLQYLRRSTLLESEFLAEMTGDPGPARVTLQRADLPRLLWRALWM